MFYHGILKYESICFKTEHLDDERKSLEGYKSIADTNAGSDLPPYLLCLYFKVIEQCLLKHSKRPSSSSASLTVIPKSNGVYYCTCVTGDDMVV